MLFVYEKFHKNRHMSKKYRFHKKLIQKIVSPCLIQKNNIFYSCNSSFLKFFKIKRNYFRGPQNKTTNFLMQHLASNKTVECESQRVSFTFNHQTFDIEVSTIPLIVKGTEFTLTILSNSYKTPFSNAEKKVLSILRTGASVSEIATKLNISPNTVKFHLKSIYGKLNTNNKISTLEKANQVAIQI